MARLVTDQHGRTHVTGALRHNRAGLDLETTGLSHARGRVRLLSLA
ncbi:hypothetical protein [Gemmata massiliana]|nr:hypothetical protein [Gemmata massiliana]